MALWFSLKSPSPSQHGKEVVANPLLTVLLAEDHVVVRQGLRILIEAKGDIKVVAEAKTGREAVSMAAEYLPDVIVMDIAMPLLNGIQAAQQILHARPRARILILSAHADPEYVDRVMELGAVGYITKQTSAEIVARAVREVHAGKTFFSASIAKHLRDKYQGMAPKNGAAKQKPVRLTSREAELLQLIAEGHVNKAIASELGISIKTVEKHRQHLMQKLHIHEIAGLTRYAIAAGVIESSVQPTTS
jgi:DNA-binding NarL/FixJ family response regulator